MSRHELTDLQSATLVILREKLPGEPTLGKDIANRIGLKPRSSGKEGADMRSIIHALRIKGYPICATTEGYFMPASREQLRGYIESFQARVDDQQAAVDGMREGLSEAKLPEKEPKPMASVVYRVPGKDSLVEVPAEQEEAFLLRYPGATKA